VLGAARQGIKNHQGVRGESNPPPRPSQGRMLASYTTNTIRNRVKTTVTREGLEPSRRGGHSLLRAACLPFHHLAINEQWTVEGIEPSFAGCKPAVFPVRRHAQDRNSGPGGDRTHIILFKRQVLRQLSYKASQCVGQESNLHSNLRAVYSRFSSPVPADTFFSTLDGIRTHDLHLERVTTTPAGPPGHLSVAQGGFEPPASLHLKEGGLPVAYQATYVRRLVKEQPFRVPGGSRTRLSGLEDRRLGRSATGTARTAEGEGVEPSRLVARPGSGRVPSPVGLPFRWSHPLYGQAVRL
jgi:hypothetical protein